MRKLLLFTFSLLFVSATLNAQTDAQYTLFPWASLYYNPGTAGEQTNNLCFTGIFLNKYTSMKENQWLATQTQQNQGNENENNGKGSDWDSPIGSRDFMFNIEYYSRKIRGAFGISLVSDNIAIWNNMTIRLGYAYKMKLAGGSLGIGIQAEILNQTLSKGKIHVLQDGDPLLNFAEDPSEMNLDFNFGVYYKNKTFDVGISAVNLLGVGNILFNKNKISKPINLMLSGDGLLNPVCQLYIHGGYIWTIPWLPDINIEPKALLKTDFASVQLDLMLLARYKGIYWGGVGYRIQESASIAFGARPFYNSTNNYLKGLDVGFSYGFTTTKFGYTKRGSNGDIEIMIRYCLDFYKTESFSGYGSTRSIYKNQY